MYNDAAVDAGRTAARNGSQHAIGRAKCRDVEVW
jgi:hypothetical protein